MSCLIFSMDMLVLRLPQCNPLIREGMGEDSLGPKQAAATFDRTRDWIVLCKTHTDRIKWIPLMDYENDQSFNNPDILKFSTWSKTRHSVPQEERR
jgi:hypothetical protein